MTCGICNPKAFRTTKGMKIWGYATIPKGEAFATGGPIADLHFIGCETVVVDVQTDGSRSGFAQLNNAAYLRKGDRLVLDRLESLGADPEPHKQLMGQLEKRGVEVVVLTPEASAMRSAA